MQRMDRRLCPYLLKYSTVIGHFVRYNCTFLDSQIPWKYKTEINKQWVAAGLTAVGSALKLKTHYLGHLLIKSILKSLVVIILFTDEQTAFAEIAIVRFH